MSRKAERQTADKSFQTCVKLQLWALSATSKITCYKESTAHNAPWSPWSEVSSTGPDFIIVDGCLGSDNDIQLFEITDSSAQLYTTYFQASPNPTNIGTWTQLELPPETTGIADLTLATLKHGRLQLFVFASRQGEPINAVHLFTKYQTATEANALWSNWQPLPTYLSTP